MEKKGQVAIYVIIAIVIAVVIVLVWMFYPKIKAVVSGEVVPSAYLKSCISPQIKEHMTKLSQQGGYENPEGYILYKDQRVKYLCYSAQYYKTCAIQQPMIKTHFEEEMNSMLQDAADTCMNELKGEYEARGYSVSSATATVRTELLPGKVRIHFDTPMTVSKGETQTFKDLNFEMNSKMYELLMISGSIIDYEATYGDSEVTLYTQYYPNLIIQKDKLGDGSKVYNVTDVTTRESFMFASRSNAWPAGYGITG